MTSARTFCAIGACGFFLAAGVLDFAAGGPVARATGTVLIGVANICFLLLL